jgi:hypothetical protein
MANSYNRTPLENDGRYVIPKPAGVLAKHRHFFLRNAGKKCEGWEKSTWTTIPVFLAVKSMSVLYSIESSHTYQIVG